MRLRRRYRNRSRHWNPSPLAPRDPAAVEEKVTFSTDEPPTRTGCRVPRLYIAGRRDAGCAISAHDRPFQAITATLYRALRNLNPSPYLYFVDLGDFQIVGSSPEILVRLEEGK